MPSQILGKKILGREVMTQRCLRTALAQAMRHIESASNSFGGQSNDFLRLGGIILLTLPLSNINEDFSLDYQIRSLLCTSTNENSLNVM